jgi:pilin isopeptide linkage protein
MKINYSKILAKLLIFTMFLMVFSPVALAEAPGFELPVTVRLSGSPPTDDEDYKIIMEADNPDYPMPDGSINGKYTQIITGARTVKLPKIEYSSLGVYTYTINQEAGTNRLASYDDKEYNLVVYVTNAEGGSGLETTVRVYLLGEEDKQDEVLFENDYAERPPLPDTGGEEPPEVIDEEPPPEVVDEEPPPETEDRIPLPQTSDDTRIWPYVGLFISGAAMILLLGMTIKKRSMEE